MKKVLSLLLSCFSFVALNAQTDITDGPQRLGDSQIYYEIKINPTTSPDELKTRTLILTGSGEMPTLANGYPWNIEYNSNYRINTIELSPEITSIAEAAFANFVITETPNPKNSKLKHIGKNAFSNCTELKTIHIPASVEYVAEYAFDGCWPQLMDDIDAKTDVKLYLYSENPDEVVYPIPGEQIDQPTNFRPELISSIYYQSANISVYIPRAAELDYYRVLQGCGFDNLLFFDLDGNPLPKRYYSQLIVNPNLDGGENYPLDFAAQAQVFRKDGNRFTFVPYEDGGARLNTPIESLNGTYYENTFDLFLTEGEYIFKCYADGYITRYIGNGFLITPKTDIDNGSTNWAEVAPRIFDKEYQGAESSISLDKAMIQNGDFSISGNIEDATSYLKSTLARPFTNATVYLTNSNSLKSTLARPFYEGIVSTQEPSADGSYKFEGLPAGDYKVFVDFPGLEDFTAVDVSLSEEQPTKILNFGIDTDKSFARITAAEIEFAKDLNLSIYPNPTQDILTVENLPLKSTLRLSDMSGRTLITIKSTDSRAELSLKKLPAAQYILTVENAKNRVSHKIVKQ